MIKVFDMRNMKGKNRKHYKKSSIYISFAIQEQCLTQDRELKVGNFGHGLSGCFGGFHILPNDPHILQPLHPLGPQHPEVDGGKTGLLKCPLPTGHFIGVVHHQPGRHVHLPSDDYKKKKEWLFILLTLKTLRSYLDLDIPLVLF